LGFTPDNLLLLPGSLPHQNKSFNANWTCREEVLVKVVAPALSVYE
jgi:hypothetical protein